MPLNLWRNDAIKERLKQAGSFKEYIRTKTQWLPTTTERGNRSLRSSQIEEETEEKIDGNNFSTVCEKYSVISKENQNKEENHEETEIGIRGSLQVDREESGSIRSEESSSSRSSSWHEEIRSQENGKDGSRRKKKKGEVKAE